MAGSASLEHDESSSNTSGNIKTGQTKDTEYEGTSTNETSGSQNTTTNSGSVNSIITGGSKSNTTSSSTTSDQINTSQLLLSQAAVDHIVKGMLEGTNGLAAVSSGQKQAGTYGSSANELLVNDLLSRTAGEVAARSAVTRTVIGGTTTTGSSETVNSGNTVTQNIGGSTSTTDIGAVKATQTVKGTSAEDILTNVDSSSSTQAQSTKAAVKVGWILCTELYKQGRMPWKHYVPGASVFAQYPDAAKRGYYLWAVPALKHLRAHPYSRLSRTMCSLLNSRAEYLAAEREVRGARKTALGFVSKNLYYICLLLGHTVARDYQIPDFTKESSNG